MLMDIPVKVFSLVIYFIINRYKGSDSSILSFDSWDMTPKPEEWETLSKKLEIIGLSFYGFGV